MNGYIVRIEKHGDVVDTLINCNEIKQLNRVTVRADGVKVSFSSDIMLIERLY